ncbi:MAG: AAA family ATPase [Sphingomonas sp.]|nr:AAA family ATPase [Sphingomonas sp.]
MQRVLVIGSPGSGKSTLATELARRTGLPLIHLDQQYWRPGWVEPPKQQWVQELELLLRRDRWIMDGNFGGSLELRLARADTVIDLRLPPWLCLARIVKRVVTSLHRVRPDMAEGCPERFDLEFLVFAARFSGAPRKRTDEKLSRFTGTRITLRSAAEVRRFLASVDDGG